MGASYNLRHLMENASEFEDMTIDFQVTTRAGTGERRVDMTAKEEGFFEDTIYLYEYKSVSSLPPQGFATQFAKDLENGTLDEIRWRFDKKKLDANGISLCTNGKSMMKKYGIYILDFV